MSKYFRLNLSKEDFPPTDMKDFKYGDILSYSTLVKKGNDELKNKKTLLQNKIKKLICPNDEGFVDLSKIQKEWFPIQSDYSIFISHSHANKDLATALAYFFKEKYKLSCFVDSLIWGNAFEILKEIDGKYSVKEKDDKGNPSSYFYNKRNYSTSHIFLMLNAALMQSMQNSQCFIFLDTPDSVNFKKIEKEWTYSPWIFSELSMSKTMYELEKNKNLMEATGYSKTKFAHEIPTSHLTQISLSKIEEICNGKEGFDALSAITSIETTTSNK